MAAKGMQRTEQVLAGRDRHAIAAGTPTVGNRVQSLEGRDRSDQTHIVKRLCTGISC